MLRLLRNLLAGSRLFVLIPIFGSFVAAVALTVYGAVAVVSIALDSFRSIGDWTFTPHEVERTAIDYISLIDIFLLGTVLYIVALGLYELFIDADLPLPYWLRIDDLDDLKEKLIGVVVVLLGVTFLGRVVSWDNEPEILPLGLAVGAVIAAFALLFRFMPHRHLPPEAAPPDALPPPPSARRTVAHDEAGHDAQTAPHSEA